MRGRIGGRDQKLRHKKTKTVSRHEGGTPFPMKRSEGSYAPALESFGAARRARVEP